MQTPLNTRKVMIEVKETSPILTVKKRKIIQATVVQTGSEVELIKAGDTVMCFNEGNEIAGPAKVRIVNDLSVIVKL